jgi:DNA-binding MurR/RpiR family transcriptional regulator
MTFKAAIESYYPTLSQSHKKIARYIGEHYDETLFLPLTELAEKIGTSPATIVRFSRAVGFSGYASMQKSIQSAAVITKPKEETGPLPAVLSDVAIAACANLVNLYQNIDMPQLARVCDALMSARDVLIIGYMDSFGTAAELLHRMYGMRDNVHFSRLLNDWNNVLNLMNPQTLILAVSFAPHYSYTYTCVTTAKARGSRVILMTESLLNPFSAYADETLVFKLLRGGKELGHEQLDLSPVSAFIQFLSRYIVEHYPDKLLEANLYHEQFVDE